ncbi:TPA: fimbrial protein [Serratia marcescens]|nr:type 1 fimbrial protein [Serratia marcescens]
MTHRIKNIGAFCLLWVPLFYAVQAISAMQGEGRVNMQGAIIDTACAIATESREQIIDMEVIPFSDIVRDGQGRGVDFNIDLINCVLERADKTLPDWKQFKITFDGNAEGDFFGIGGDISGVALRIVDAAGNIARPGIPLPPIALLPGDYRMGFSLSLVANNKPLKAGSYFSSVRFKMDYY